MSRLAELLRGPQKVLMGRLAEDYDGIGQYVMVTLAQSSVASAYKARVAAGDFGGGRRIPKGTRVPVFSQRGRLEVLLGNRPREILCEDSFNGRSVVNGWGLPSDFETLDGWRFENGEIGDDWVRLGNPEYFSVVDGMGLIDTDAVPGEDPWIWFYPKGDPTTWDHNFEYELRFKMEVPTLISGPLTSAQFDFYLGDSEKVGSIGSIGDTIFGSIAHSRFSQTTTVWTDYFGGWDNANYFEHEESGHRLFNTWVRARLQMQNYQLRWKIWPEDESEPDWMAGQDFPDGIVPDWSGLKIMIIGPYRANSSSPFTTRPFTFHLDYVKDIFKNICRMSGDDFVPVFNGPVGS